MHRVLQQQLIVCVGPGGVGKTTTAAALAYAAALAGRRTAVITVDPARRLKDALGLSELSMDPHRVEIHAEASFDALALDAKRAFDALIQRLAPNPETAQRIQANRLYQELSNGLAGSAEYMAMEKLHELVHSQKYDTVIVDTPPSSHARDLLAAPNKLMSLLASRAVSLLQSPSRLLAGTSSAARVALSTLLKALERWTGLELLRDLGDFVSGFESMIDGFSRRADEVNQLLRSPATGFVLVTTADPYTVATTIGFHRELSAGNYPIAGVVANRVLAFARLDGAEAAAAGAEPLGSKLLKNYAALAALATRQRRALQCLHDQTGLPLLAAVPAVIEPPTSLAGLERFARALVSDADTLAVMGLNDK